jgi:plasmid stabilization system protein ParE
MHNIAWSPEALEDYFENIAFLERRWTEREARRFIEATKQVLDIVKRSPTTFRKTSGDVRQVPIVPQITMYYRISGQSVQVLRFWNNYQNPERLRV